jgi:hypothetical protein
VWRGGGRGGLQFEEGLFLTGNFVTFIRQHIWSIPMAYFMAFLPQSPILVCGCLSS